MDFYLDQFSTNCFAIVINKDMKKFVIDSIAALFIITLFIPLMVLCMIIAAWEFGRDWPKQIIEIVNVYHASSEGEDTQI